MNVEKLTKLKEAVAPGWMQFGEHKVAFTLAYSFGLVGGQINGYPFNGYKVPERSDLPNPEQFTAVGCLMAFTHLLFGEIKTLEAMRRDHETSIVNLEIEAAKLLELDRELAFSLFYDRLDRYITGKQAASVIQKLIVTGVVDWDLMDR